MSLAYLTPSYLAEVEQRARRFAGAYTGTSGTLAADCLTLLKGIKEMQEAVAEIAGQPISLEEANRQLREAVEKRIGEGGAASAACAEPSLCENVETFASDYILKASQELAEKPLPRLPGDSLLSAGGDLRPGSAAVLKVLDEAGNLHLRKSLDYGADEDALRNIKEGADLINVPSWQACLIRIADKMSRMRAYCRRGEVEFDGVEDNLLDIVSYAAIALAEYRRENAPT